jgi:guanylate kinase
MLIIISAPSGGGKTTVIKRLSARLHGLERSISYTTRPPRNGEREGVDYHFINRRTFEKNRVRNFFLEWARVHGHYYGTSRASVTSKINRGRDVVLAIDVQGMRSVRRSLGQTVPIVSIFLRPPTLAVLKKRLQGRRTDSNAVIAKRLKAARWEVKQARDYDTVVVNRTIAGAVRDVQRILRRRERALRAKQTGVSQDSVSSKQTLTHEKG